MRDDFICQLQTTNKCKDRGGKTNIADLTLDHVVPKSHGGKTAWANVTTSCKACNSAKGDDHTILPKTAPIKPSYYQILAKRKTLPIQIKDPEWAYYIQWPEHLVKVVPHQQGAAPIDHLDDHSEE